MTAPTNKPRLTIVIERDRVAGFLLRRRPGEVEAFTDAEHSVGIFRNEQEAAAKICTVSARAENFPSLSGEGKPEER
jgi:hypothetical protein